VELRQPKLTHRHDYYQSGMCARNKQAKLNQSETVYRVVVLGVCGGEGWWGIGKQLRPPSRKIPRTPSLRRTVRLSATRLLSQLQTSDFSTITPAAPTFTTCTNPRTACNCALSTAPNFSKLPLPPVAVRRRLRQLQSCLVSAPTLVSNQRVPFTNVCSCSQRRRVLERRGGACAEEGQADQEAGQGSGRSGRRGRGRQ
jgi:hypothetical protein